jgi:hypothetical protein
MPMDNARKEKPKTYAKGEEGLRPARNTLLYESHHLFKKSMNCTAMQLSSPDTINIYFDNLLLFCTEVTQKYLYSKHI